MVSATHGTPDQCYDLDVVLSILRLLSGRTRVEILSVLADDLMDVQSIADRLCLDPKTVSQHLHPLRAMHVVRYQAIQQRHAYRLNGSVARVRHHPQWMDVCIAPSSSCAVALRASRRVAT